MTLKFAELEKIERALQSEARDRNCEVELGRTAEWLSRTEVRPDVREVLTRLAAVARSAKNRRAAQLALGSLVFFRKESETDKERCRAILEFARQCVDSMEKEGVYWANVVLASEDEADARALFEAAIGDESYSIDELRMGATHFIRDHESENSSFGRLAADLNVLLGVLDGSEHDDLRDLSKAALTYFVETADAIPDGLGLVGLLDDAFVVQQAVGRVLPNRASLTSYLENRVRRWPFLKNLRFEVTGQRYPISDYMLINSALLLDVLNIDARSSVILIPEAGPLLYLLGLVAALSRVAEIAESESGSSLEPGERLMDRDGRGEVVFRGYVRAKGTTFTSCDASSATHVQLLHPARGRQAEMLHTIRVAELGNFRRTAVGVDRRKKSAIKIDVGDREVGALEQLLGANHPIMLDSQSPQVLVVASIEKSRELATSLELFGVATADVVPTAHLRRGKNGFDVKYWSKYGVGGEPLLSVVRSVDEAYECVLSQPFDGRKISTVVASVRRDSVDGAQLARIADEGVGVLAFVQPEDSETLEIFGQRETSFWSWDPDWFGLLYWPASEHASHHPVAVYERRVKGRVNASHQMETVQLDALTDAGLALAVMETSHDSEDLESLADWLPRGWRLLVRLCRRVTPVTLEEKEDFIRTIREMSADVQANQYRWSEELQARARDLVASFERALSSLVDSNPKFNLLQELAKQHSGATLMVSECDRVRLAEVLSHCDVQVVSRVFSNRDERLRIVPAWYGRSRMDTLIFGSTAESLRLVLYEPEVEWFNRSLKRRSDSMRLAKDLVAKSGSIPIAEHQSETKLQSIKDTKSRFGDVDEVFRSAIRRLINRSCDASVGTVKASVVGFVGGTWAAFTPAHRLITVGHLIDSAGEDRQDVVTTDVANLRNGDVMLLLSGSDRDAVRERAEQELSSNTIKVAEKWKRALKEYTRKHPNLDDLQQKLAREGCNKMPSTIRSWVVNDYVIGPQHAATEVAAIAAVTGDTELIAAQAECVDAISTVRSAHVSAGKWLADQVVQRAREWADAGATPGDLVELEDRFVMVTVDFVDVAETDIAANLVNRLQSSSWLG